MEKNKIINKNNKKKEKDFSKGNPKKLVISLNKLMMNKNSKIKSKKNIILKDAMYAKKKILNSNIKLDKKKSKTFIKRKTFISLLDTYKSNKYLEKIKIIHKNIYCTSLEETKINWYNKNLYNRSIINKMNHKKEALTGAFFKTTIKNNSETLIKSNIKKADKFVNNTNKKKLTIESYNNKKIVHIKNKKNIQYDISNIIPKYDKLAKTNKDISKRIQKDKNVILKTEKKQGKGNEDFNTIFDIESEHKKSINIKKLDNYNVNKPHDYNMKYSLIKDKEDEENNNLSKEKVEKIIIGNIEGYQDIIESDKKKIRKKRANQINFANKASQLKFKKNRNENKSIKYFEGLDILDDNSSEFYDLNFVNNYYKTNENLLNIEKEYAFEDLPTNEIELEAKNIGLSLIKKNNKTSYYWQ
jgi:hypothetical protein